MGHVARAAISLLLVVVVLKDSIGAGEAISAYDLNFLYVVFGFVAFVAYAWRERVPALLEGDLEIVEDGPVLAKLVGIAILSFWLVVVLAVANGPGFPESNRGFTFGGVLLLVTVYPFVHHRMERLIARNWPYLLAFGVLAGVYLLHGAGAGAGSGRAAFPVAVVFLLVANLFVVPRYVPIEDFLWAASRISAVVVLLGIPAYAVGEYTAIVLPVELRATSFSPPMLPVRVQYLQSIFPNPNTTGLLVFVGTVASLAGVHRVVEGRRSESPGTSTGGARTLLDPRLALAAALLLVNGLGLYLTYSRASMLAAGLAGVIFLAYAGFGRDAVPRAVALAVVLVVLALSAVAVGLLSVNPGGRFVLWRAGVEAFLRAPRLLGEGVVAVGPIIEPFVTDPDRQGAGVHNSYLTTLIRAGLVGGVAYVVLVVGSVVHALAVEREVPVAAIALGVAFALHQTFESYTLFQHTMGAILSSLTVGYVIAGIRDARSPGAVSPSLADTFDRNDARSPSD